VITFTNFDFQGLQNST